MKVNNKIVPSPTIIQQWVIRYNGSYRAVAVQFGLPLSVVMFMCGAISESLFNRINR